MNDNLNQDPDMSPNFSLQGESNEDIKNQLNDIERSPSEDIIKNNNVNHF